MADVEAPASAPAAPTEKPTRPWFKKKRWWALAAIVLLAIPGLLGAGGGDDDEPAAAETAAVTEATTTTVVTTTTLSAYLPLPADFELGVIVTDRSCFGSAGCNIRYDIDVAYHGQPLDPADTWQVIYEVRGGDSGPAIGNFEVQGDRHTHIDEDFLSTGPSYRLTAVATAVRRV